jgi:trimethylamine:corrinoid methyltransferase-like protein
LDGEQRERIATAVCDLLEGVGVKLTEPEARDLLRGAGAPVEGARVRIPADPVKQGIESAPSGIGISTRDGELAMDWAE